MIAMNVIMMKITFRLVNVSALRLLLGPPTTPARFVKRAPSDTMPSRAVRWVIKTLISTMMTIFLIKINSNNVGVQLYGGRDSRSEHVLQS